MKWTIYFYFKTCTSFLFEDKQMLSFSLKLHSTLSKLWIFIFFTPLCQLELNKKIEKRRRNTIYFFFIDVL